MKILHRYILIQFSRNFFLALLTLSFLFLIVDFFDRIDNISRADASFGMTISYFLLKMPLIVSLMLPPSMLAATMFTIGLLSRNSELTAMRATGVTVLWLGKPLLAFGLLVSVCAILINEFVVPGAQRRVREIYNIDIMHKDKAGTYNQSDFWWRDGDSLYSVAMFDSRTDTLLELSKFELTPEFHVSVRQDAKTVRWLDPQIKWSMKDIAEFRFVNQGPPQVKSIKALPLPIRQRPEDFYDVEKDPYSMSFARLKKFIKEQARNGVAVNGYYADLYEKLAFPFVSTIIVLVVFPFMVRPARTSALASNFFFGLLFGFVYYVIHSTTIAFGRAEITPPFISAWAANILMCIVGLVLTLGSESPN
jgi:lipopolysaccharide export system permease protein